MKNKDSFFKRIFSDYGEFSKSHHDAGSLMYSYIAVTVDKPAAPVEKKEKVYANVIDFLDYKLHRA